MKEHILSGTAKGHMVTVKVNEQRGITLAERTTLELSDHDVRTLIAFLRGVSARHEHPALSKATSATKWQRYTEDTPNTRRNV